MTGSYFLGSEPLNVEMTLEWFGKNLDNIFVDLYVGTLFYSVFGSLSAYWLVNHFWKSSVHKDKKLHRNDRES
jgi:hypothetical protein